MDAALTPETDVIVIGAGPVGLTLANEVKRGGGRVRIVDQTPSIREISKALIWHVRTQEVLDRVGIFERGEAEAMPLREVVVRAYGKRIGSWHLTGLDSPHQHPLIIGQNRTQHLLADLLASQGAAIEWGTEAVAIQIGDAGVTVTLRHSDGREETARSKYVAGCEGSSSLVRKTIGLTFEGERYAREQFIQADCKIRWALPSGRSYLFLTDDGYLMVIEMPGGLVRIFLSLPDTTPAGQATPAHEQGAAEDISHEPELGEIRQNLVRLTGIDADLSDPVWLARYRTSHRTANSFGAGRAFVAGDAGHVHVPIGGQGMNTGIQDAFNLGWKLAGVVTGVYRPEILASYSAERHPVAEGLIRGTDRAYRGILDPSALQQKAARMFGPYLLRQEPVQKAVRNILEEMTIAYPNSPLNRDCGGSTGPKPGERVRDATIVRASDLTTLRLRDLTRDPAWTLLLFGGTSGDSPPQGFASLAHQIAQARGGRIRSYRVFLGSRIPSDGGDPASLLLDAEGELHERYGVTEAALYLLRPDDFVGFRGSLHDGPALIDYLNTILNEVTVGTFGG